jgi:probable rRNA maturation factor
MAIFFHTIDVDPRLKQKRALKRWINDCVLAENKKPGDINIIFCSDDYLLEINRTHLEHDYYTDIITFDFTTEDLISGDLYISFDRVKDNALHIQNQLETELYRVIIHGVMHLCGYKDKTKNDALRMRQQEEKCLGKITF